MSGSGAQVLQFGRRVAPAAEQKAKVQPGVVHDIETITNVVRSPPDAASRVQLRLALTDIEQADRDIALIRDAAERALKIVAQARRAREPALLGGVRTVFEETNRRLGAYRRPKP